MKRGLKLFSVACLVLASVFIFAACGGPKAKTFEGNGIKITTTTDFKKIDEVGFELYLYSSDAYIYAIRQVDSETFSIDNTLNQYTEWVIDISMPGLTFETYDQDGKLFNYFTYENDTMLGTYKYLNVTLKSEAAFYMVEFACYANQYDSMSGKFMDWAKTIEIS